MFGLDLEMLEDSQKEHRDRYCIENVLERFIRSMDLVQLSIDFRKCLELYGRTEVIVELEKYLADYAASFSFDVPHLRRRLIIFYNRLTNSKDIKQ